MTIRREPSCEDASEPDLLPVDEARRRLLQQVHPLSGCERLRLDSAMGRTLFRAVVAAHDVPMHDNSAMDGYAVSSNSIPERGEAELLVLGTAWAGRPFDGTVAAGQAVRIFTGAIMPRGCDTVVIQERVRRLDDRVWIDSEVEAGRNVRSAGEDVLAGSEILPRGRRLEASDIGVLASLGITRVEVTRPVRVACFTTGDELRALGDGIQAAPLPEGCLYDSNAHTLRALLNGPGIELLDLGIVRDDADETRRVLTEASRQADVVISSGGVSAGEADHVTRVFHELGEVAFWKLAMRPGRPLAFGRIEQTLFFGLPGNPVAVVVTFLQFVQPALQRLQGREDIDPLEFPARCESRLRKSPGRREYQRGVLARDEAGELVVRSTGKQGAGRLSSVSAANCLIVLDEALDGVEPGQRVTVQPFHGLLSA